MTAEERAIWGAAYAAAFVADFKNTQRAAEAIGSTGELPSDAAARITGAEYPAWVADLAVRRLREWRLAENPETGVTLGGP